jgi:hypothetical protein
MGAGVSRDGVAPVITRRVTIRYMPSTNKPFKRRRILSAYRELFESGALQGGTDSAQIVCEDREETNRSRNEQLQQSLRHPHPESLEMAEAGFAAWADGLPEDASDIVDPEAGVEVRWTADQGWGRWTSPVG